MASKTIFVKAKGFDPLAELHLRRRSYGQLTLKFLALFLVGSLISFYLYYVILDFEIRRNISLRPKAIVRYIYMNLPFPLTVKIYIFQVLNKEEVQNGGKPHLREIGPYVFHEYIKKVNVTDYNLDDAVEFTTVKKYIFRPELSHGLTGDEIVTTLHPLINGIGMAVHLEHQQFMHVAVAAIEHIFHKPTDAFWTGRAMDLIYDGIEIDCSSRDPLVKIACGEIKRVGQAIQRVNDTLFKFSLLGGYNDTANGMYKVLRGKRYPRELGRIIELDGVDKMKVWRGDKCNQIIGTDGLIFPPFQTIDEPIQFYVKNLCLNIDLKFKKKTYVRGIRTRMFEYQVGNIAKDESRHCYCRRPNHCPINGTLDLMPCLKVPVTGSLPHFMHADPSLMNNVASGLQPTELNHSFTLNMELRTGVPLSGVGRFQLNFELEPVPQIQVMSKLPKMIFPFIWFEEGAEVPDGLVNLLKYSLIFGTGLNRCLQYVSLSVGLVGTVVCFIIYMMTKFDIVKLEDDPNAIAAKKNSVREIQVRMANELFSNKFPNLTTNQDEKKERRWPLSARSLQ